jgi:hypothetical protein
MTESLGEVPQESAVLGNLLGVEADIVGKIEKFGEAGFGLIETATLVAKSFSGGHVAF